MTAPTRAGDRQAEVEARAEELNRATEAERADRKQHYGPAEQWMLDLGPYRFLLMPFLREWWFHDTAHDEWRYTGHRIGEVRFEYDGERLTLRPRALSDDRRREAAAVGPRRVINP